MRVQMCFPCMHIPMGPAFPSAAQSGVGRCVHLPHRSCVFIVLCWCNPIPNLHLETLGASLSCLMVWRELDRC